MFMPTRLTLARKRRGLSATELARRLNITSQAVYDFEKGRLPVSRDRLLQISKVLNFPPTFFAGEDLVEVTQEQVSFRARSRIPAPARDAALSAATLAVELSRWINGQFELPAVDVPTLERHSPEEAAAFVRAKWGLGEMRAVPNVVHLLEAHGVRVFSLAPDFSEVDAFSFWRNKVPFVILNTRKSAERGRFDAAHELGHLVLHSHNGCATWPGDSERDANRFASNLLMPQYSVLERLRQNPAADQIIHAKRHWGVAALALAYRANDLGLFTEWNYRRCLIELGRLGYRTGEPRGMRRETSQVMGKVSKLLRESGSSHSQIATELGLYEDDLSMLVFGLVIAALDGDGEAGPRKRPDLGLVQADGTKAQGRQRRRTYG